MLDLRLVTPPTGDVLPLDLVREHVRVSDAGEETILSAYLAAAVQAVQDSTGRLFLPQVWEFRPSGWRHDGIRLPFAPVTAVGEVASVADDGTVTTVPPEDYRAMLPSGPTCERGWIVGYGGTGAPRIRFTAGYAEAEIPAPLRSAILLLTGSLYENREAESERSGAAARVINTNPAYERLLAPYRLIG